MPFVDVKLFDRRVTAESVEQIIKEVTDGLCRVFGEQVRPNVWVVVQGVPPSQWGIGGTPGK